ncbi:MAG: TonB-dependent receptor [Cyanobacteria bacterium P01_B01_bin.77]
MKRICTGSSVLTASVVWAIIGQWHGVQAGELFPTASFDPLAQAEVTQTDIEDISEDEAVEDNDTLRIIVTAERTPDTPQDVPISLTVLTEQQLEDGQINSLAGIAQNTPNFFLFPSSPGNLGRYSIRGIGNSNFLSRDAVGFFINDVPYDSGLFNDILLSDLERVEILRGPQNLLYGRSSIGGVVNIVTRPPAEDLEVRTAASYGSDELVNLQLSISDTLVPETLGLRLTGAFNRQDGLVENTFLGEDAGDRSEGTGLAELRWTPSPDWTVSLTGTVRSSDNDGFLNQTEPFITEQDELGFVRLNSNSQALKVAYEHKKFQVNSITTRRFTNFDRQLDADGTSADLVLFPLDEDTTLWSQEIRVQSPAEADQFRWLLGGYYEARNVESNGGFEFTDFGAALLGLPSPGLDSTVYDLEQDTFAVFGKVDYKPIDPLTLTAGLRYETNTARLDRDRSFEAPGDLSFPAGLNVDGEEQDSSALLPRFALEYRFSPNVVTYASATRGYRPGGLNSLTDFVEALEFEEETSWNYEIGVKTNWLENRLWANLSAFINEVSDYQVLLFDELFTSSTTANADVRISGLELELGATPMDGLDIVAGFGFLDDEFTKFINPLTGADSSGNHLPSTPEFNYNLSVQYRDPSGLLGRVELQGFGTYFFDEGNQFEQDPFALVNARLGYEGEDYGIYAFVNNLFDEEYLIEQFVGLGNVLNSFGDRRTFGVQVRATF